MKKLGFGLMRLPLQDSGDETSIDLEKSKADCVGCRQCERQCPQHIPIVKLLKEFSDAIDFRTGHDY